MKLILHIGTHKTGTTALQRFLHANRAQLAVCGFHYATPPHGVVHANLIANALSIGKTRVVHTFLAKHTDLARRRGAHTVLLSSENFYAMSVLSSMQRRQIRSDAVERDRILIETLYSLMPEGITTPQVVCYFRRPDRYAESLYNQHVKRGTIFDGTFAKFLPIIRPALFYNACIGSWSGVFGKSVVRLYEAVTGDIVGDFVRNVMNVDDVNQFRYVDEPANERVGRDLLEFKRMRNRTARFGERDLERTILGLVDKEMDLRTSEPAYYQDFLSPDERAELLRLVEPEMEALQASHDVPAFPPFDLERAKANWTPYPGLGPERRQAIESQYDLISRRFGFRFERLSLRSASLLRRNVPSADVLLDVLRSFGAKHALRRLARRIQLGNGSSLV
jgi:hypothetical protein